MSSVQANQYFPAEVFRDRNGPCVVKYTSPSLGAGSNNNAVVAAVSGKRITVINGNLCSVGAAGFISWKSASGGAALRTHSVPVNTAATPNVQLPFDPAGHMTTIVGEGLYADNSSAAIVVTSIAYIEWTP